MSNNIRLGRNVVCNLHVHLVFLTKKRGEIFTEESLDDVKVIFGGVCTKFGAELVEFYGGRDYVHLLVSYPPKVAVSNLVNSLKGVSSRLLRKKYHTSNKKPVWGEILWSPSYFAGSCGGDSINVVRQYIYEQSN